jgi:hypothetical protein
VADLFSGVVRVVNADRVLTPPSKDKEILRSRWVVDS